MRPEKIQKELLSKWDAKLKLLFGDAIPTSAQWSTPQDIQHVLTVLAGTDIHVFLPTGGGEDIAECRLNGDILEWSPSVNGLASYAEAVRPVSLKFWHPGRQTHDANFVLQTGALEPLGQPNARSDGREEIVEVVPGTYAPRSAWDHGEYRGEDLPDTARLLSRSLQPGRFAIFSKGSIYNTFRDSGFDAYDAFHNSPAAFESAVKQMADVEFDLS